MFFWCVCVYVCVYIYVCDRVKNVSGDSQRPPQPPGLATGKVEG